MVKIGTLVKAGTLLAPGMLLLGSDLFEQQMKKFAKKLLIGTNIAGEDMLPFKNI